jgi:hypothetical protein
MQLSESSRWIALLESPQQADGTRGRFHAQYIKLQQPFPTIETAVAVALDSGLDSQSHVLQKTMATILDYMEGKAVWPDWPEKHDNPSAWWVWVRHI